MATTMLFYALSGVSILSCLIATILHGLTCATLQSLPSPTYSIGLAPVSLSAVSCIALVMLSVLVCGDIRSHREWPVWKINLAGLTGVYLIIAAGSTAGTTAINHPLEPQTGLRIARAVFWDISVFTQGLYAGFILLSMIRQRRLSKWPRSYLQELKSFPESPNGNPITPPPSATQDPYSELRRFDTRRSSLRKFPRRSNRYSGGTLCPQPSDQEKHASFDTTSAITLPEQSPTRDRESEIGLNHDRCPPLHGGGSIRTIRSLDQLNMRPSLDTLVQPSSPSASSFHLDSPSRRVETLNHDSEHHIHPLFRSTSPSPSPTPTPGTMVKASPSAGQTITKKTLSRMRSTRSLRDQTMRAPSLPGYESDETPIMRSDSISGLPFIHAGHVRRSVTQYEKRYDLNESPDEK